MVRKDPGVVSSVMGDSDLGSWVNCMLRIVARWTSLQVYSEGLCYHMIRDIESGETVDGCRGGRWEAMLYNCLVNR